MQYPVSCTRPPTTMANTVTCCLQQQATVLQVRDRPTHATGERLHSPSCQCCLVVLNGCKPCTRERAEVLPAKRGCVAFPLSRPAFRGCSTSGGGGTRGWDGECAGPEGGWLLQAAGAGLRNGCEGATWGVCSGVEGSTPTAGLGAAGAAVARSLSGPAVGAWRASLQ